MNYLLLQSRKVDDPMRGHERDCFAREIGCAKEAIQVFDLTSQMPSGSTLDQAEVVLLGGSGDYSVLGGYAWLDGAFETLRELHRRAKPTFASCWGFQAFALALGGEVVTDKSRAELGTIPMRLTPAGKQDPVFGPLSDSFGGQSGHQDIVESLPPDAVLLASSDTVENEAFTFAGKPIYCTQFHPELNKNDLLIRLKQYPQYIESIFGQSVEVFERSCFETPDTSLIVKRFIVHVAKLLEKDGLDLRQRAGKVAPDSS